MGGLKPLKISHFTPLGKARNAMNAAFDLKPTRFGAEIEQ